MQVCARGSRRTRGCDDGDVGALHVVAAIAARLPDPLDDGVVARLARRQSDHGTPDGARRGAIRRGCLSVEVHARVSLVVAARVAVQASHEDVVVERVVAGIVHGDPHADVQIVSVVRDGQLPLDSNRFAR